MARLLAVVLILFGIGWNTTLSSGSEQTLELRNQRKFVERVLTEWVKQQTVGGKKCKVSPIEADRIVSAVLQTEHPLIVLTLIKLESQFNCKARRKDTGVVGLMQVHVRSHAKALKKAGIIRSVDDLWDSVINIRAGAFVLKQHLVEAKGNMALALSRYSGKKGKTKNKRYIKSVMETCNTLNALCFPTKS